jgi:uncharacterized SAM-binding protein YcdF (DUF218 family)
MRHGENLFNPEILCRLIGPRRSIREARRQASGSWQSTCVICHQSLIRKGPKNWISAGTEVSRAADTVPRRARVAPAVKIQQKKAKNPISRAQAVFNELWGYTKFAIKAAAALCLIFTAVLFSYLYQVEVSTSRHASKADAIVTFSGDPERVRAAGFLLARGYARKLFVVGEDNGDEVARLRFKYPGLSACCIQHSALSHTTREDAYLAQKWVILSRSRSVILVTSGFHVPRAMVELKRALPGTPIEAIGVGGIVGLKDVWGDDTENSRLLRREYPKYITSSVPGLESFLGTIPGQEILGASAELGIRRIAGYALLILLTTSILFVLLRLRQGPGEFRDQHRL